MRFRISPFSISSFLFTLLFLPLFTQAQSRANPKLLDRFPYPLSMVSEAERSKFRDALLDAGENWRELQDALIFASETERSDVVWLINEMPHLDRLEMTSAVLLEHVREAQRSRKESFAKALPESLYREHLLTYRLDEEPCEAWRKPLRERFAPIVSKARGPLEAAKLVNRWVAKNIKRCEPRYFGPEQSPRATLTRKKGTQTEIAVLTTAALRSVGLPCRMATLGGRDRDDPLYSWLEIYSAGVWAPLYPLDPGRFGKSPAAKFIPLVATSSGFKPILVTGRYTQTGRVRLVLKEKGGLLPKFKGFSVSVVTDGAFKPLDDLGSLFEDGELQTDSAGSFSCELGKGHYLAVAGKRDLDGNPSLVMKEFVVVPGPTTEVELDLAEKK
jgi:transglutaminase-like putative cysteine protease